MSVEQYSYAQEQGSNWKEWAWKGAKAIGLIAIAIIGLKGLGWLGHEMREIGTGM